MIDHPLDNQARRPTATGSGWGRLACAATVALAMVVASPIWTGTIRGQEEAAPGVPGATDLLRATPFDRITLTDNAVILTEPISPRPLPPYDPKKDRSQDPRRPRGTTEGLIKIVGGDGSEPAADMARPKRTKGEADPIQFDSNNYLTVHLIQPPGETEVRDFKVRRFSVKSVEYFEDMLIAEADRLTREHQFARAFEHLLFVKARAPEWAGQGDALNRLLFAEGSEALLNGDFERGVRLLRELFERKKDYPGLEDKLATAYTQRALRALQLGLYPRGREVLHQLEVVAPTNVKYLAARSRYIDEATKRLEVAKASTGVARLDTAIDALRVWPELKEAQSLFGSAFAETPTLDVGVVDVPIPLGPWLRTHADARVSRLLYRPILNADDGDSLLGKPPGQLAEKFETTEVGRRLVIRLRSGGLWSDASRPVSSIDVVRTLIDRTDPNSPRYRARWADILERVEAPDESRVEVQFNRPPLRIASWFVGPVGPAHASEDGRIATTGSERAWVTDGPYLCSGSTADRLTLLAAEKSQSSGDPSSNTASPRIRRIREIRISDGAKAVSALIRGDVSLLENVPPSQLAGLKSNEDVQVGTYEKPFLHQIAFDGRNPALRNRSLKRALSYAIDRKGLLEGLILKQPTNDANLVSDGPLPRGSYADAPDVRPFEYNPMLAQMLLAAARKELGGLPISLKFEYPDTPEARAVAPVIAEAFRVVGEKSGFKVELIERRESELESELRGGRRFDLAYRVVNCDDAVVDLGPALCPGLDAPSTMDPLGSSSSPRILQLLLELERASEFPTAKGIATQIDRESRTELPILPLWQVERHYAWRTRLKGILPSSDRLYKNAETWEIAPWFARDPWTVKKP